MRLIDADGSYTLNASDNTDYSLCFGGAIISVIDKHGHIACEFFADDAPTIDAEQISDGYHTFADLYNQRLVLSAALAKNNPNAWKSKLHEDGSEPFGGGWFIMGWSTPEGEYTYHYELKDWYLFECAEIPRGKHWDGHTDKDVKRLLSMPTIDAVEVVRCKDCENHALAYCRDRKTVSRTEVYCFRYDERHENNWFCADGERKEE